MGSIPAAVRPVRIADKTAVLEISSKIWGGHDYLPSVFDEWLADKKSHVYGVEADGKIVAIGNMRLVDGGKTGWMEGLRVHPDYRKRGFADMITRHFVDLGKSLSVERLRYSTGGNNRASLKLARKAGFKRLFKMGTLWYEDLDNGVKLDPCRRKIEEAAPKEVFELLKANPLLIPSNVFVYEWKAVDATLSNLKDLRRYGTFYATVNRGKLNGLALAHRRKDSNNDSLSFSIYARDENTFLAHFNSQIRSAAKLGLGNAVCTCPAVFGGLLKTYVLKPAWKLELILLEKRMIPN